MIATHFQTFVDVFSAIDEHSRLLAGNHVLWPPVEDFGYQSTPKNAVTFASMGVDGVHYALLKIRGEVRDDSPVVYISPVDSEDIIILASSLLSYLAEGCDISEQEMQSVFDAEQSGKRQLVAFLSEHFSHITFPNEERAQKLMARYGHLVERKVDDN